MRDERNASANRVLNKTMCIGNEDEACLCRGLGYSIGELAVLQASAVLAFLSRKASRARSAHFYAGYEQVRGLAASTSRRVR